MPSGAANRTLPIQTDCRQFDDALSSPSLTASPFGRPANAILDKWRVFAQKDSTSDACSLSGTQFVYELPVYC